MSEFHLDPARRWALDIDQLERAVTERTALVMVNTPNNPTGQILSLAEMEAVIRVAEHHGAWLLADEVYAGSERDREEWTPTFYGRSDRVIANGLSVRGDWHGWKSRAQMAQFTEPTARASSSLLVTGTHRCR